MSNHYPGCPALDGNPVCICGATAPTPPTKVETPTPRTDTIYKTIGWCNCEHRKLIPFAQELERETISLHQEIEALKMQNIELHSALLALKEAVKQVPEMQHRDFVPLGIQVNKALENSRPPGPPNYARPSTPREQG